MCGGGDEAWFYLLTVQMEMDAAPGLVAALMAQADLCTLLRLLRDERGAETEDDSDRVSPTKQRMMETRARRAAAEGKDRAGEGLTDDGKDNGLKKMEKRGGDEDEEEEEEEGAKANAKVKKERMPAAERERRVLHLLSRLCSHCRVVAASLAAMTKTFRRMRENCDPRIL